MAALPSFKPPAAAKPSASKLQSTKAVAKVRAPATKSPVQSQPPIRRGTAVTPSAGPAGTAPAAPAPATPARAPVNPFLTPTQQGQEDNSYQKYQAHLLALHGQLTQAPVNESQGEAQNVHNSAISREQANAVAAAHGVLGSGVQSNSLTDIATKLALNNNILRTNLGTLEASINGAISGADLGWNGTALGYQGLAEQNAQNAPPSAAPAPAPATGAAGGATVATATKPPTLVSKTAQPVSSTTIAKQKAGPSGTGFGYPATKQWGWQ